MIMKIKNLLLPLIIIIAGFSSCYPIDDLKVEDLDIAATIYDKAYYDGPAGTMNKFEALHTFTGLIPLCILWNQVPQIT
jgi:hypothetical protein